MTMPHPVQDREHLKFRDATLDRSKVAVTIEQDPANPIPINVNESPELPAGYESVNYYNQVLSVATSVNTTVISKTITDTNFFLDRIEVGGSNKAIYTILINASIVGLKRTYYTYLNESFSFSELKLNTGDTIEVKALHERPVVGDFEARIIGVTKL